MNSAEQVKTEQEAYKKFNLTSAEYQLAADRRANALAELILAARKFGLNNTPETNRDHINALGKFEELTSDLEEAMTAYYLATRELCEYYSHNTLNEHHELYHQLDPYDGLDPYDEAGNSDPYVDPDDGKDSNVTTDFPW